MCKFYNQREDHENIFPSIENQTVNRYLKKIGEIAEIKKTLHFHLARHTFGTTLLNNNVNVFYISKMMGHKKTKSNLRIYRDKCWKNERHYG
ncbi:tyrosine-type recombinase/integrase [Flavobacterium sp. H4147]|uniref:tyrosine-type recombinase/integrase n=1 Tax=Flavobacterium sp. H4147 TaxID=3034149 RepID=UPI0035A334B8